MLSRVRLPSHLLHLKIGLAVNSESLCSLLKIGGYDRISKFVRDEVMSL